MENDLFTIICNGDIQNSILVTTKTLFLTNDIEYIEETFINICGYIGSFVSLYDVSKYIDILSSTKALIENEKLVIKDIYVLLTKMCIICDIYNKHPTTRCGTMSMKVLKEKLSNLFDNADMKLSANGIMKFDGVLPPVDNENYQIALRIITILIKTIKSTDNISIDHGDVLSQTANKLRNILDYVTRTKYKFETKFYNTDTDNTWFLWGVYSILYNEVFISDTYWLYNYNFKKKNKAKRIGLLWSIGIMSIYIHKRDISKGWTDKELLVISKIDEIALQLYNEIRHKIIKENPTLVETTKKEEPKHDGLNFIIDYIPVMSMGQDKTKVYGQSNHQKQDDEVKSISY
jgi:hypothetical protein